MSGDAPVVLAWERYYDLAQWPTWSPQISSVESSAERLATGVTGTIHAAGGVTLDFEITAVDEAAMSWSWTIRRPPLTMRLRHTVAPAAAQAHSSGAASAEGSSTSLTVDGPLLVVMAYVPLATAALTRLVAA